MKQSVFEKHLQDLIQWFDEHEVSRYWIAKQLGVSHTTVARWWKGSIPYERIRQLNLLKAEWEI